MRSKIAFLEFLTIMASLNAMAAEKQTDIFCKLTENGQSLECQLLGKQRVAMGAEDVAHVIDSVDDKVYITARSRAGIERVFLIDGNAPSLKSSKK